VIAEDSEDDLLLVLRVIRQGGYDPLYRWVSSAEAMRQALDEGEWDVVIADHSMPGFSGLEALRIAREVTPEVPFLLVSGTVGEEVAVEAMRSGARDYVLKGNLVRLPPAIERELEQAASRRERRRLEDEVRQMQKIEAIGRLAGGVAHDFNNLLTAINGFADLVLERLDPADPAHGEVREIRRAGERASDLTRQLLAFGRRQVLAPQVLDLGALVRGMQPMLRRLIGEDVELVAFIADDPALVRADPGQLEQVVLNLAINARDAMPTGGRLTIEVQPIAFDGPVAERHLGLEAGRYVQLAVTDTGVGMDDVTRAHVFEPFFTTKPPGQGTGLGLSTVWGIVRQSGGQVWFYSEPGVGTAFKLYFPLVSEFVAPVAAPPAPRAPTGGSETILVVEDEEAVRGVVVRQLARLGYTALVAPNAEAARRLAVTHAGPIDLLLTDVVMPGIGGPTLARELQEARPGLPVLFVSGYTDDTIVKHGVLEPGVQFLQKPFTADALGRRVREVLDAAIDDTA
jgi:signal transduction histidine kinase